MSITNNVGVSSNLYRRQKGIGLIEVLVAMLVVGVGLLGLAALQANGLKSSRTSYYRTQATVLAYDMADRMRANSTQAALYETDPVSAATGTACSTACSTAAIANTDLLNWSDNLAAQLPAGDGAIDAISATDNVYSITVRWADKDGNIMDLVTGVQL